VIGDGPERVALERLTEVLDIASQVTFCDFLPGDEIYGVMKSAGVFVLPSVREGFGAVVLEANACGLPVVTVDHPDNAARHLIFEGGNGFVVALVAADIAAGIEAVLDGRADMHPRQVVDDHSGWLDWHSVSDQVAAVLMGSAPQPLPIRDERVVARPGDRTVEVPA
jgi:glycosyltransferase involved in cell wall biosynthesis